MIRACFRAAVVLAVASTASADVRINEIMADKPDGGDNGFEYFELLSLSGGATSMTNLWLLQIDGDGLQAGVIDQAFNLSSFSTGSNGLFLWRDSATVLNPPPATGTSVNVLDFTPDLENGSQTWLLVNGFTGSVGLDLDLDNDGVIDNLAALPWAQTVDGIGFFEESLGSTGGQSNEFSYARALGFAEFPSPLPPTTDPGIGLTPDTVLRLADGAWIGGDLLDPDISDPNNPFVYDSFEFYPIFAEGEQDRINLAYLDFNTWSPGGVNPSIRVAEWTQPGGGNWSPDGNWSIGVTPNGVLAKARLGTAITGAATVTLDSPVELSVLEIDSPNSYVITGAATLTIRSALSTYLTVTRGSHEIATPTRIRSTGTIQVDTGASLTLTGSLRFDDGVGLIKAGGGRLNATAIRAASLEVDGGVLGLLSDGTPAGVSAVRSLEIGSGASVDLADNGLVVDYDGSSPLSEIRAAIISGRSGGSWNGPGINSSTAAATSGTGIGYLDASGSFPAFFNDINIDGGAVLIRYTLLGDTNLSGVVDIGDFSTLAANFNTLGEWAAGDFDYSGGVTIADFSLLATNFNRSVGATGARTAVPEPGALLGTSGMAILLHRRRRQSRATAATGPTAP